MAVSKQLDKNAFFWQILINVFLLPSMKILWHTWIEITQRWDGWRETATVREKAARRNPLLERRSPDSESNKLHLMCTCTILNFQHKKSSYPTTMQKPVKEKLRQRKGVSIRESCPQSSYLSQISQVIFVEKKAVMWRNFSFLYII